MESSHEVMRNVRMSEIASELVSKLTSQGIQVSRVEISFDDFSYHLAASQQRSITKEMAHAVSSTHAPHVRARAAIYCGVAISLDRLDAAQSDLDWAVREVELNESIVGHSVPIRRVKELLAKAATSDSTVLITGESGTGKELAARIIHILSARAKGPFVAVNCGAVTESLLEKELFGSAKGAFTGAGAKQKGYFEAAHSGTIFLDEFGDMTLGMQLKLLRVLQERKLRPVGDSGEEQEIDVRVIVATNKNLAHEIEAGRFRRDLYYRVNVFPVRMPALRERPEDLPLLAEPLLKKAQQTARLKEQAALDAEALAALGRYGWPGNVRELENVLERLSVKYGSGAIVGARQVREEIAGMCEADPAGEEGREPGDAQAIDHGNQVGYWRMLKASAFIHADREFFDHYQKLASQRKTNTEIAESLGIGRSTLFYRLKRIKSLIVQEESTAASEDQKRWFYYWSRGLQPPELPTPNKLGGSSKFDS